MTVTKQFRVVVLISGAGSNLQSLIRYVAKPDSKFQIALAVSDRATAGGLVIATEAGINTVVAEKTKTESREAYGARLGEIVSAAKPDLVVLAGFMRVLSANFIALFQDKLINIHPSLLPAFRGLRAQAQALSAGVKVAGCTVHLVDEEVDAGPILGQAAVHVLSSDTEESLRLRILEAEHKLLPLVVDAVAQGKIRISRAGMTRQIFIDQSLNPSTEGFLSSIEIAS